MPAERTPVQAPRQVDSPRFVSPELASALRRLSRRKNSKIQVIQITDPEEIVRQLGPKGNTTGGPVECVSLKPKATATAGDVAELWIAAYRAVGRRRGRVAQRKKPVGTTAN